MILTLLPLPVLLLTWLLYLVILVFLPLLTRRCYLLVFRRTLTGNILYPVEEPR